MPALAASSSSGFSSGGRVNIYGVWHVPIAATISPMVLSLGLVGQVGLVGDARPRPTTYLTPTYLTYPTHVTYPTYSS